MNRMNQIWGVLVLFAGLLISCTTTGTTPAVNVLPSPSEPAKKLITKVIEVVLPRLIKEDVTYADGTLSQASVLTYDTKGNLVREELFNHRRALVLSKNYQTSSDGSTQTITTTTPTGEVQGIDVRQLDDKGQILKETLFSDKKEIQSIAEYSWDKDGIMLLWISKNPDNKVIITTKYAVQDGKVTAIEILDSENKVMKHFDQQWNDQGLLVEKTEIDPSAGVLSIIEYHYQDKLLLREDYLKADGTTIRSIEYIYKDLNLPDEIRLLDKKGQVNEIHKNVYQVFSHPETIQVLE